MVFLKGSLGWIQQAKDDYLSVSLTWLAHCTQVRAPRWPITRVFKSVPAEEHGPSWRPNASRET